MCGVCESFFLIHGHVCGIACNQRVAKSYHALKEIITGWRNETRMLIVGRRVTRQAFQAWVHKVRKHGVNCTKLSKITSLQRKTSTHTLTHCFTQTLCSLSRDYIAAAYQLTGHFIMQRLFWLYSKPPCELYANTIWSVAVVSSTQRIYMHAYVRILLLFNACYQSLVSLLIWVQNIPS